MRKTLLLLFASSLLLAQNAELFNNDWYISQMIINNQTTVSPVMQVSIGTSKFMNSGTSYNFNSSYYNSASSTITFSTTTDSFTRQGGGCTLAIYNGTNATAAQAYDQKNCDFYINPALGIVFNYQIVNNGGASKTLIITNSSTGDKVFYNNAAFLGIRDNHVQKAISIYPNPVKDYLILDKIDKNSVVKIFDVTSKLILKAKSEGNLLKIDISHLTKGQYIIQSENFPSQKFIKE